MIKDRPHDQAIEVTVTAPDDMNVTNVQELAQKAWRSVNKTITINGDDGEGPSVWSLATLYPMRLRSRRLGCDYAALSSPTVLDDSYGTVSRIIDHR